MGDVLVVLVTLLALLAVLLSLDYRDGNRFACLFAEDRDTRAGIHGYFQYSEDSRTFVNRGEREVCLEDVIDFVNRRRMGPDMQINTVDDAMTLEQQIDMVGAMLEANFHGGFWASTPWRFQYHGGTPIMSKLLYADPDEVVVISGSRTAYSGMLDSAATTQSVFLLEGRLRFQRTAPLRGVLLAPLLRPRAADTRLEAVSAEGELWQNAFRIKKRKQLLYSTAGPAGEGAFFLHYYSGSMLSVAVWEFIWPCLRQGDFRSAWIFTSAFAESFYRNGVLPLASLFFKKDDVWWNSQTNLSRREATSAAFSEEVFAEEVDTGEEDALPAFRKQIDLLKQQKQASAVQRSRTPERGPYRHFAEASANNAAQQQRQQPQEQQERREKHISKVREGTAEETKEGEETEDILEAEDVRGDRKRQGDARNTRVHTGEWRRGHGREAGEGRGEKGTRGEASAGEGSAAAKGASSASEREEKTRETEDRERDLAKETADEGEAGERVGRPDVEGRRRGEEGKPSPAGKDTRPTEAADWEEEAAEAGAQNAGVYSAKVFKEALEMLRSRFEKQKQAWLDEFSVEDLFPQEGEGGEDIDHEEL